MPKVKQIEKCKHPNSRKTKALAKQLKKQNMRGKSKLSTNLKQNILGEKLQWFRDNLDPQQDSCTAEDVETLILQYLGRFDDELEQIRLKHAIGQRKNRQHASREDIINMTLKHEREEFKTAGLEMPDLLNVAQFNLLRNWTGELRFLQNFKLRRFSINNLNAEKEKKKPENIENKNINQNEDQQEIEDNLLSKQSSENIISDQICKDSGESSIESMDFDR